MFRKRLRVLRSVQGGKEHVIFAFVNSPLTVLQAPTDFTHDLARELESIGCKVLRRVENFFIVEAGNTSLAWAEWAWHEAEIVPIPSISKAVKELRSRNRFWVAAPCVEHRRSALIGESLSLLRPLEIEFGRPIELPPFGAFALLNKDEMIVAKRFEPSPPLGRYNFKESREAPSRAYLKLWEALTRGGQLPKPGERCLDLGSAPGGWTWALAKLGCDVLSVDRAELAPHVLEMPKVKWQRGDAFSLKPESVGTVDWIFSDVICYPEKLFEFVSAWIASGKCKRFVCTIKFQGEADPEWIEKFKKLGGTVLHLSHNKHEVTWIYLPLLT